MIYTYSTNKSLCKYKHIMHNWSFSVVKYTLDSFLKSLWSCNVIQWRYSMIYPHHHSFIYIMERDDHLQIIHGELVACKLTMWLCYICKAYFFLNIISVFYMQLNTYKYVTRRLFCSFYLVSSLELNVVICTHLTLLSPEIGDTELVICFNILYIIVL